MPMGISFSPSMFQREMQRALSGLIGTCCLVYLDDLIVFSKDLESHLKHVEQVFKCLRRAGLMLKCLCAAEEVELLS